jgi:pimeloyl-ACP methyl ester carboxylesterase
LGLVDGGFKNAAARQHYLTVYAGVRALSPRPDVVHDVETELGTVRVYQHGPSAGEPVVLVHGFFLTSAMWWEQVAGLTSDFTVYAIDMLGQPGASTQTKKMSSPAEAARCIAAVLEKLDLNDVHLVGHSYGGWLATHAAAGTPHRLATLTLVDPAHTVVRLFARFWRTLALLLSRPRSARAQRAAAWVLGDPTAGSPVDALTGLFVAGFVSFAPPLNTPPLRFPSSRLLRSVDLPVQVLLAGNTVHNSAKAIRRLASVVPTWRHHVLPNASHALFAECPDEVNDCILQFAVTHRRGAS